MSNIEIRLIRPEEYTKANDLYNKTYGNKRPYSFFEWEFINGPAGKAIYVIAVDKDKDAIIGTQSAIPLYFLSPSGEKMLTAKSEDTLVDPAYRGMKLFDRMYEVLFAECKKAGITCIWGFTYALKPFQKVGFDVPFSQSQGAYVINPVRAYNILKSLNPDNKAKDKVKILGFTLLSKIKPVMPISAAKEYTIETELIEDKTTLIKGSICIGKYYVLDENKAYIKWRITDNPNKNKYSEITVYDLKKTPLVNITVNLRENGVGYIEQILPAADCSKKALDTGIRAAIKYLQEAGADLIRFWGFDFNPAMQKQVEALSSNGFSFINRGTGFVWYDCALDGQKSINPHDIFINRIYTQGNN